MSVSIRQTFSPALKRPALVGLMALFLMLGGVFFGVARAEGLTNTEAASVATSASAFQYDVANSCATVNMAQLCGGTGNCSAILSSPNFLPALAERGRLLALALVIGTGRVLGGPDPFPPKKLSSR